MNGSGTGSAAYHSEDEFEDFGTSTSSTRPGQQYGSGSGSVLTGAIPMSSSIGQIPSSSTCNAGGSNSTLIQAKVELPSASSASYTAPGTSQALPSVSGQRAAGGSGNICSLLDDGRRCQRSAGNASYSKRVQKTVFYKRLRLDVDNTAHHTYICDHHKTVIQTARVRVKKESDEEGNDNNSEDGPEVDLYQLQVNTLRRYKKHFKIPTRPGLNKAQLADILTKHFKTIPVNEKEVVTYFIYSIKSGRNKLDNPQPAGVAPKEEYLDPY